MTGFLNRIIRRQKHGPAGNLQVYRPSRFEGLSGPVLGNMGSSALSVGKTSPLSHYDVGTKRQEPQVLDKKIPQKFQPSGLQIETAIPLEPAKARIDNAPNFEPEKDQFVGPMLSDNPHTPTFDEHPEVTIERHPAITIEPVFKTIKERLEPPPNSRREGSQEKFTPQENITDFEADISARKNNTILPKDTPQGLDIVGDVPTEGFIQKPSLTPMKIVPLVGQTKTSTSLHQRHATVKEAPRNNPQNREIEVNTVVSNNLIIETSGTPEQSAQKHRRQVQTQTRHTHHSNRNEQASTVEINIGHVDIVVEPTSPVKTQPKVKAPNSRGRAPKLAGFLDQQGKG